MPTVVTGTPVPCSCCVGYPPCDIAWTVSAVLGWANVSIVLVGGVPVGADETDANDYDLYAAVTGGGPTGVASLYNRAAIGGVGAGGLILDKDSLGFSYFGFPDPGDHASPPPETISGGGTGPRSMKFWWADGTVPGNGDGVPPTTASVTITNTGANPLKVNGVTVAPAGSVTLAIPKTTGPGSKDARADYLTLPVLEVEITCP